MIEGYQTRQRPALAYDQESALYVSGGYAHGKVRANVFTFDLRSHEWRLVAPLKQARVNHSSCALKKILYVFGGRHREQRLESIEMLYLDLREAEW